MDQETNTGYPPLRFTMGFAIDGTLVPDPSVFTGSESDLDTLGERDATGYLHRDRVTDKHPLKIEYRNIPWALVTDICTLMNGKESFRFTDPDPFRGGRTTMTAYAGDREFEAVWAPEEKYWLGNLKFSVIEY